MIKIVRGVYGHYINGRVVPKDSDSKPFELKPEQEDRLVKLRVAVYVGPSTEPDMEPEQDADDGAPVGFNDTPPEMPDLPDGVTGIPEYSMENTGAELRAIGELCGLTFGPRMTKAEMIAALDKHIEENTVEGYDADPEEEASAEDDAPTFDPADAVVQ